MRRAAAAWALRLCALAAWGGFMVACERATPPAPASTENAAPAQRIVSFLPSFTETVYALGAQDRLVGVSDFCHYPPEAAQKPRVGGIFNPNLEKVLTLKPDLVLIHATQGEFIARLHRLGLRTASTPGETVADALEAVAVVGRLTGSAAAAARLVESMRARLAAVGERARGKPPVSALIVIGHEPGALRDLWAAAPGSFHDQLLMLAGGVNTLAADSVAYPRLSMEDILSRSPRAIIVLDAAAEDEAAQERERALWRALAVLPAVRDGRVCVVGGNWTHVPGPRMPKLAEAFADCLRGPVAEPTP